MQDNKTIDFKKRIVLKRITNTPKNEDLLKRENEGNSLELTLKSVELYEPIKYKDLINLNKKRYKNAKIKILKNNMNDCLYHLKNSIEIYKELINRTEFWERKSTYDFNFKDWNTLKKANGKLTRYFNEIKKIAQKIESEEL